MPNPYYVVLWLNYSTLNAGHKTGPLLVEAPLDLTTLPT